MSVDNCIRLAERLGIPVLILAAILWVSREAATSVHNSVIVPIVKSHTEFLESTSSTLHELGETQSQQAETLRGLADGQREIHRVLLNQKETP